MLEKSQQSNHFHYDILVVGSGLAALSYILAVSQLHPSARIALIAKDSFEQSNSFYAQGGIAAANNALDIEQHIQDTFSAGGGLSNQQTTPLILQSAPAAIRFLQQCGIVFDQDYGAEFGQEAGHSARRIYSCGDRTGRAIVQVLYQAVSELKNLAIYDHHLVLDLIADPLSSQIIRGISVLNQQDCSIAIYTSQVVILATGGAGHIYRYTSNPNTATGDGIAMAYRAGAKLTDMEFYQFHPTLLHDTSGKNNLLLSETLRGEGAYLLHPLSGKRFILEYEPIKKELATRDKIARAIACEIQKSNIDFVYLDITHKPKTWLQQRFPKTFESLLALGIDISKDPIPIVPGAHYLCGGVSTDINGQTNLNRLFVIGEAACSGLHGANRLASNSLLECVVMAVNAASTSLPWLNQPINDINGLNFPTNRLASSNAMDLNKIVVELRKNMSNYAGIIRNQTDLINLHRYLQQQFAAIENNYQELPITRELCELRNMLTVAKLITHSALTRKDSAGCHYLR